MGSGRGTNSQESCRKARGQRAESWPAHAFHRSSCPSVRLHSVSLFQKAEKTKTQPRYSCMLKMQMASCPDSLGVSNVKQKLLCASSLLSLFRISCMYHDFGGWGGICAVIQCVRILKSFWAVDESGWMHTEAHRPGSRPLLTSCCY